LLIGLVEGMDIHIYVTGLNWPLPPNKPVSWTKVAIVEEAQNSISDRTCAVVVEFLANKLAHEIRNLNLNREQKS
jgi:hypothetical protein